MNLKNKLLIIFLACSLSNCSTSSAYMKDRGNDIADIFDLSVGGISAGGVVYLGEKKIGAIAAIEGAESEAEAVAEAVAEAGAGKRARKRPLPSWYVPSRSPFDPSSPG